MAGRLPAPAGGPLRMPESNSLPLFTEDAHDALKGAVAALGGAKKAAQLLWPNQQGKDKALLDCLNPNNDRKLDLNEILALLKFARQAGYHKAKHWIDAEIGYEPTPPKSPEIERDRLAEALERAASSFDDLTRQAKQLLENRSK